MRITSRPKPVLFTVHSLILQLSEELPLVVVMPVFAKDPRGITGKNNFNLLQPYAPYLTLQTLSPSCWNKRHKSSAFVPAYKDPGTII